MQMTETLDDATDRVVRNVMLAGVVPALVIGAALFLVNPIVAILASVVIAGAWVAVVAARVRDALTTGVYPLGA